MTRKILRLFVNTLNGDDKYSLLNRGYLTQPFKMHSSQIEKDFCQLFGPFFKSTSNFEHFQRKMTLIGYVFPKLQTPKDMVR